MREKFISKLDGWDREAGFGESGEVDRIRVIN